MEGGSSLYRLGLRGFPQNSGGRRLPLALEITSATAPEGGVPQRLACLSLSFFPPVCGEKPVFLGKHGKVWFSAVKIASGGSRTGFWPWGGPGVWQKRRCSVGVVVWPCHGGFYGLGR